MIDAQLIVSILMDKFGNLQIRREPSSEEISVLASIERLLFPGSDTDLSLEYNDALFVEITNYEGTDACEEGQNEQQNGRADQGKQEPQSEQRLVGQKSSDHSVANNTEPSSNNSAMAAESFREPLSEDDYAPSSPESFGGPRKKKKTKDDADFAYKAAAVLFSRNSTGRPRKFSAVKSRYHKCTCIQMLKRWAKEVEKGGSREYKVGLLHQKTYEEFTKHPHGTLHDIDIQRFALEANRDVGLEGFRASGAFVVSFKKRYDISFRSSARLKTDAKMLTKISVE